MKRLIKINRNLKDTTFLNINITSIVLIFSKRENLIQNFYSTPEIFILDFEPYIYKAIFFVVFMPKQGE